MKEKFEMNKFFYNNWKKLGISLGLVFVLVFGATGTVNAVEYIDDGVIQAKEVIDDDAFVSGQNVVVDGTVNGVLFATGEEVLINGTINGDAILLGRTLTVSKTAHINGNLFFGGQIIGVEGNISGSIFGGGMAATLGQTASVGRNFFYGGYSLEMKKGSIVNKDMSTAAYQLLMGGWVGRDVNANVGALQLDGTITRNLNADVSSPSEQSVPMDTFYPQPGVPKTLQPGLRVSDSASIGGKLVYTSPVEQQNAVQSTPVGGITYKTPVPDESKKQAAQHIIPAPLTWGFDRLRSLIVLLIFGALILWLMPRLLSESVNLAQQKPLPAAGIGLLTLIVGFFGSFLAFLIIVCIGAFLSIITLGGLSSTVFGVGLSGMGLVFALFLLLVNYVSKILVAYMAGRWIMEKLNPQYQGTPFLPMLIGIVVYVLLSAIPFIGWIFSFVATLIGLGAMWMLFRNHTQRPASIAVPLPTAG
jgi:hypothetical protein